MKHKHLIQPVNKLGQIEKNSLKFTLKGAKLTSPLEKRINEVKCRRRKRLFSIKPYFFKK